MRWPFRLFLAALLCLAVGVAGFWGRDRYVERYTVTTDDGGAAVARVVAVAFHNQSALKVASINGLVQTHAVDTRMMGMLQSDRVMKAPFSVDYFLDVSRLSARDLRWDAAHRTLTVDVPPVTPGTPNVDESRATLVQTRGLFVTRTASETMSQRASAQAQHLAAAEAQKPEWIARARENARRSLTALLAAPLQASGVRVERVDVRFPDERGRPGPGEPMDRSRSLDEVFGLRG